MDIILQVCVLDCQRELVPDIIFRGQLRLPVMSLARKQLVYDHVCVLSSILTTFICVSDIALILVSMSLHVLKCSSNSEY